MSVYSEASYENAIMELFATALGYERVYGPDVERDWHSPLYESVLEDSIRRINPKASGAAIGEALQKVRRFENAGLAQKNALFMEYLQNGIEVSYPQNGEQKSEIVYLADFAAPENNSFIVANQWTFIENSNKRPDILIFLNGLPVCLFELKSPSREQTDANEAYTQIRNYMHEIPSMFIYNCICVMSDQLTSKAGTITSGEDRFMEWKTKDGNTESQSVADFTTFFEGMFQKERLLDIIKNFICFDNDGGKKILAGYHQYFAVRKAVERTKLAVGGDGKIGVFWHTQGSGKSLSMVFYAHLLQSALESPTIVVITDRNDLDNQLYGQFARCKDFLRQSPVQAESRAHLKSLLEGRKANGIIFTTMQKFEEGDGALSERRNVIVMADEAHRGHYGLAEKPKILRDEQGNRFDHLAIGTARIIRDSLPNASYIGFTGTPISREDRSTVEVFGDYIDIYDMTQAVQDGATRPVYYESRVIKLNLDEKILARIDAEYSALAQNAAEEAIEKSKRELGTMEEILGNEKTINSLVEDILCHYENERQHLYTGKAMIVAYSRAIAMKIFDRILELRPSWAGSASQIAAGGKQITVPGEDARVAVVMTESNKDPEAWRAIIGNKRQREELAKRFKDDKSSLKIAIVVDMWLTGFDVPSLATMYVYKPMESANLMQAIARVNRVFEDKEGGLVVDYIGIASALKQVMNDYTVRDRKNYGEMDIAKQAYPKFLEKLEICRDLFFGYDYSQFYGGSDLQRGETISLFDAAFLENISKMKEKNLAVEMLKKLINEQVKVYKRTNLVKSEEFSERIRQTLNRYLNGMLTNEEVIQELLKLAQEMLRANEQGDKLGLNDEELAFYDALTKPDAVKDFYSNEELIALTKELAETLRKNKTIDWQKKESARAKMRMLIKKLLKKYKYPPEGQEYALKTVISQCELWTDNLTDFDAATPAPNRAEYAIHEDYGMLKVADSAPEYNWTKF